MISVKTKVKMRVGNPQVGNQVSFSIWHNVWDEVKSQVMYQVDYRGRDETRLEATHEIS